jgi:hypothetical protein
MLKRLTRTAIVAASAVAMFVVTAAPGFRRR